MAKRGKKAGTQKEHQPSVESELHNLHRDKSSSEGSNVHHPRHYNLNPSGVECIDVIEHLTFNIGAAIKHLWRQGEKKGTSAIEDLEKAAWYTTREIERLEKFGGRKDEKD